MRARDPARGGRTQRRDAVRAPHGPALWLAVDTGLPNAPVFRRDPHLAPLADDRGMHALLDELDRHEREIRAELGREPV